MGIDRIYTDKQKKVLREFLTHDYFITGLHGAKRSGKTVINNDIFLMEVKRARKIADEEGIKEPLYILAGVSSKTIQTNVLQELYNRYNFIPKFDKHGNFSLFGVKIVSVYTGSISGLGRARGFTASGAYVNEASLANESVFKEIINRCSAKGARIIWDSNPDNPNHWLNQDYIGKNDGKIADFRFRLDDNTFLSKRYVDNIKNATPSGKFYDRDILGLWTVAEGAVYADYDSDIHEVNEVPDMVRYFAGVDWGFDHYGSIVIIGESEDGCFYLVDGLSEQYQGIEYWKNKAKELKDRYGNIKFWADSARPDNISEFKSVGIDCRNASKSVMAGIEEISRLFKEQKLFIKRGVIPRFFDEIYQYKWKAGSTKDEPEKQYDDVLDALRYAIYSDKKSRDNQTASFETIRAGLGF